MQTNEYPFQIGWLIDNQVLYAHMDRQLGGADEASVFNDRMLQHIESAGQPVFLIMDLRQVQMQTTSPVSRLHKSGSYRSAPGIEYFITVTASDRMLDFVTSTVIQMAGKTHLNMKSLRQAVDFVVGRIQTDTINYAVLVDLEPTDLSE